ncbi:hypothetical protein BDW67DRAFT_86180 [Aspergillus spinulosporus]
MEQLISATSAFAASIVRLSVTHVLTSSPDATWNISLIIRWSTIEAYTGIISACLPILPALLARYRTKTFGPCLLDTGQRPLALAY